jgi:hypothetical protein
MNDSTPERESAAIPARRYRVTTGVLAAVLLAPGVWAVEVSHLQVTTARDAYAIEMSLRVAAPASRVVAVLTDFSYPDPVNPDVTHQEIIAVEDDVTRVRTEFEGCVLFICREVELIQDVRVVGGEIFSDVVPGGESFHSGRLHWRITDDGEGGSHIEFRASMAHNFFVMPLIGGYFLRKRIRNALLESAGNLEKAASR